MTGERVQKENVQMGTSAKFKRLKRCVQITVGGQLGCVEALEEVKMSLIALHHGFYSGVACWRQKKRWQKTDWENISSAKNKV